MVCTALQLNAAECKTEIPQNCDSNQGKILKGEREMRVKLLILRWKSNVYRIQFLNSEII